MILNFLDKLGGFLDRSFVVAYWAPVFLTLGLAGGVHALHAGVAPTVAMWRGQDAGQRLVVGAAVLVAVTALAYMLQAFTSTVVRFFEGYTWGARLGRWAAKDQRARADRWTLEAKQGGPAGEMARFRLYVAFPPDLDYVRPTRLGNVLTAAEHYPKQVYCLNATLWWPRLFPLLPADFREQISATLVPMLSLLNLAGGCALAALGGGAYVAVKDARWWPVAVVFAGGLLLARVCYLSAVAQAVAYGNLIRSAFDLYRHEVLKQMGIFVPETVNDELVLWDVLNTWLYDYTYPHWRAPAASSGPWCGVLAAQAPPAWLADPFRYSGKAAAAPAPPEAPGPMEVTLRVGWLGRAHTRRKDGR